MEDELDEFVLTSEDLLYWFPWTFNPFPTSFSIHPIFGAHPSTFYYLPAIAERDELEQSELSTERILIQELYDDGESDGEEHQEQRYTVEEPPEVEENANDGGQKLPESVEGNQGDICDVVLEVDRGPEVTLHNQQTLQLIRWKSKKANRKEQHSRQQEEEEDDDDDAKQDDFDELADDKHVRLIKTSVNSMRADLLLKAGLGIARNKVEALFYESKIRVNGKKLLKKSAHLDVGDEIDVVRGVSPTNPDHLIVSRVEILAANPKSETIGVSLRRQKTLIIEDYETDAVLDK